MVVFGGGKVRIRFMSPVRSCPRVSQLPESAVPNHESFLSSCRIRPNSISESASDLERCEISNDFHRAQTHSPFGGVGTMQLSPNTPNRAD